MHMCVRVLELEGVGGLGWEALNADVCGLSQTEGCAPPRAVCQCGDGAAAIRGSEGESR